MRRHLHEAPELGNRENKTQAYIAAKLKQNGIDEVHTGFGEAKTAVIGVLNPQKGDAVGLRADIDALLIKENTGLPFSSRAKGQMWGKTVDVSHMCGHDMHTAMLLSAARILAAHKMQVPRTVVFVFQPAEEGDSIDNPFTAGKMKLSATKALAEGGLNQTFDIKRMFGIHVMARAKVDAFQIDIEGRHALDRGRRHAHGRPDRGGPAADRRAQRQSDARHGRDHRRQADGRADG